MIKNFKIFEKLGISQLAVDISNKSITHILEAKKNNKSSCRVDISEFNIEILDRKLLLVSVDYIMYNLDYNNFSSSFDIVPIKGNVGIRIGLLNNTDGKNKTDDQLLEHIIHEVKHLINRMYTSKKLVGKRFFDDTPRFLNKMFSRSNSAHRIIQTCKKNNIVPNINNFLKTNDDSELFKKTLVYFYLADEDELESKLHEYYLIVKKTKNFSDVLKKRENEINNFKDMCNYKLDFNLIKPNEKEYLLKLFDIKNTKKVENYIRNQGKKFIKKLHKLSAFETEEN